MAWTDERVEQLKKLWSEGLSASQIAAKMGGVTRNAVIGKVHRLGLSGRATPARPERGRAGSEPAAASAAPFSGYLSSSESRTEAPEPDFIEAALLSSGDKATVPTLQRGMCKWPIGDPASDEFHFCGQPTTGIGKPYCAYHARLAFQPPQKRAAEPRREKIALPTPKKASGF